MTLTRAAADVTGDDPAPAKFGTVFGDRMAVAAYTDDEWQPMSVVATDSISFGPATHALHYASACFEGLKAHRHPDSTVRAFRADRHVARMRASAARLCLPVPSTELLTAMIAETIAANAEVAPEPPGSLYLRPTLVGTDHDIGAAASPSNSALLYVLASPVGEYLPPRQLRILVERDGARTTPDEGVALAAAPTAEGALAGTAAVRASVGERVVDGQVVTGGTPGSSPRTDERRAALTDIQTGRATAAWV